MKRFLLPVVFATLCFPSVALSKNVPEHPNVLFVVLDDLNE